VTAPGARCEISAPSKTNSRSNRMQAEPIGLGELAHPLELRDHR